MSSAIFEDGTGQSEPDGRVPHAKAGGRSGLDLGAGRSLSGDHLGRVAGFALRARRRGEHRRDLALSEIPQPHPQDADHHRRRPGPPRCEVPPRAVEAPSGNGGPAQAGLHQPDSDEDQHIAQVPPGSQGTKGALVAPFGHWRTSVFAAAPQHTPGLTPLGSWTDRSTATPFWSMSKCCWSRRSAAATSSSRTTSATTKPKRCARRSEAQVPACCSFRPAAPISTRSNRCLPSSSTTCARTSRELETASGKTSAPF